MSAFIDITGQRFGDWTVVEKAESLRRGGFSVARWLCRCACGAERIVEGTNLRSGRTRRCMACRVVPGAERKAVVTYQGLHERLRRERGHARTHTCVCGCGQPADEWSLDRYADDDLVGRHGRSNVRYALDLARYVPRCRDSHRAHDAEQRRRANETEVEQVERLHRGLAEFIANHQGSAVPCPQSPASL